VSGSHRANVGRRPSRRHIINLRGALQHPEVSYRAADVIGGDPNSSFGATLSACKQENGWGHHIERILPCSRIRDRRAEQDRCRPQAIIRTRSATCRDPEGPRPRLARAAVEVLTKWGKRESSSPAGSAKDATWLVRKPRRGCARQIGGPRVIRSVVAAVRDNDYDITARGIRF